MEIKGNLYKINNNIAQNPKTSIKTSETSGDEKKYDEGTSKDYTLIFGSWFGAMTGAMVAGGLANKLSISGDFKSLGFVVGSAVVGSILGTAVGALINKLPEPEKYD